MGTEDSDGAPPADDELGFPVEGEDAEASEPVPEREMTAMEMMGAPNRPSDSARKTVLWISLAFASVLFVLTIAVIGLYGLDILTLITVVFLGFMCFVLIGAVRYNGEDPMAKFDPPPRPKARFFGRNKK